jgi:hypothetical protein
MKLKLILACAVGAGLLTLTAGSARALVIDDEVATVLDASLVVKVTESNGKIKSATITSKDLVNAISDDQDVDFSGDEIIAIDRSDDPDDAVEYDYELVNKHGDEDEDLSEDDVIFNEYDELSESEHESKNTEIVTETGVLEFEFFSNGDDLGFLDEEDNELAFTQDDVPFTWTLTGEEVSHHSDKAAFTVTEKDGIDTEGIDEAIDGDDFLPIAGVITQDGSGTLEL